MYEVDDRTLAVKAGVDSAFGWLLMCVSSSVALPFIPAQSKQAAHLTETACFCATVVLPLKLHRRSVFMIKRGIPETRTAWPRRAPKPIRPFCTTEHEHGCPGPRTGTQVPGAPTIAGSGVIAGSMAGGTLVLEVTVPRLQPPGQVPSPPPTHCGP